MSCGVGNIPDLKITAPAVIDLNAPFQTSVFYNDFSHLLDDYRLGIVYDANRDTDWDLLNQNTRALNVLVVGAYSVDSDAFKTQYPYTYERIIANPLIIPAEVQNFLETNFLMPSTFITYVRSGSTNRDNTLYLLNQFYSPNSFSKTSMGSFCDLVPNIFAKFAQFQDIFAGIAAFASTFQNILSSLANFSLAGLIDGLKNRILSVVDNLVESIKKKIATFSSGFVNLARGANAVFNKLAKTKEKVTRFLSDLSVKGIKDKISGMISYAGSLFETLDLEEIQFLILRFCTFISSLENFFNGLTKPLEQMVSNFDSARIIASRGNVATAGAISAGAIRLASNQILSQIEFMKNLDPMGPAAPWIPPRGYEPSSGSPVSAGSNGNSARQRSGKVQEMTSQEIDELPSWDEIKDGNHPLFLYVSGMPGDLGWGKAQTLEKVMLMRLAKRWGRITINSAFRSKEYNSKLSGASPTSLHMSGQAFDCGGVVRNSEFVALAREIGFTGFGYYGSFTHIDSVDLDSWG